MHGDHKTLKRPWTEYALTLSLSDLAPVSKWTNIKRTNKNFNYRAHYKTKLNTMETRLTYLSHKCLVNAINTKNEPIVILLENYYLNGTLDATIYY
jgi:hypothetical protein